MKKNTYILPTFSSFNKINQDKINVNEKIVKLSNTINVLKTNMENEDQQLNSIEKNNNKNFILMNEQIKTLKKAFNTLSDVMMEEFESLREDLYTEIKESNNLNVKKVEELQSIIEKVKSERQDQKISVITLEQEIREKARILDKKQEEQFLFIQKLNENNREDNKILFEKLKMMINNNMAQIEILSKHQEKKDKITCEIENKNNLISESLIENSSRLNKIEEFIKSINLEYNNKYSDLKSLLINMKESIKPEITNQKEIIIKMQDQLLKHNEKIELNNSQYKKISLEIESSFFNIQKEFKENLKEMATLQSDSLNNLISDFESAFNSCGNDIKSIYKQFNNFENNSINQKDEIVAIINEQELLFSKRNENYNKAIFEICHQLNISNPLII